MATLARKRASSFGELFVDSAWCVTSCAVLGCTIRQPILRLARSVDYNQDCRDPWSPMKFHVKRLFYFGKSVLAKYFFSHETCVRGPWEVTIGGCIKTTPGNSIPFCVLILYRRNREQGISQLHHNWRVFYHCLSFLIFS